MSNIDISKIKLKADYNGDELYLPFRKLYEGIDEVIHKIIEQEIKNNLTMYNNGMYIELKYNGKVIDRCQL